MKIARALQAAGIPAAAVDKALVYSFNDREMALNAVKQIKSLYGGDVPVDVLVNGKFAGNHKGVGRRLLEYRTIGDLAGLLGPIRNEGYGIYVLNVNYTSPKPSFLVRLAIMLIVAAFSKARAKIVYDPQGSLKKMTDPSYSFSVLKQWTKNKVRAFLYSSCRPLWDILFDLIIHGRKAVREGRENIEKILVIQVDLIGDYVWTTPCLAALRKKYPEAAIHLLTGSWNRGLASNDPNIDEVIQFDAEWFGNPVPHDFVSRGRRRWKNALTRIRLLRGGYHLAIDMRGEPETTILAFFTGAPFTLGYKDRTKHNYANSLLSRPVEFPWEKRHQVHIVEHNLNLLAAFGIPPAGCRPGLFTRPEDEKAVDRLLKEEGVIDGRLLIGIHPGASRPSKLWKEEGFAEVADNLAKRFGATMIFTGAPAERGLIDRIAGMMKARPIIAAGRLSLVEFAALLKRLSIIVTTETATISLASASGTPTVCLMSGVPALFGPYGVRSEAIVKELECRKPVFEHCICDHVPYRCLMAITPEDVLGAVERTMAQDENGGFCTVTEEKPAAHITED